MKKFLVAILTFSLPFYSFADCDWSKIRKNDDGTFVYSKELHVCVGEMKQDLEISTIQKDKLQKAIELKDLVISKQEQRADMWMQTTFKLEDRINSIDKMQESNKWIYIGLGALGMFAATYAASQALKH